MTLFGHGFQLVVNIAHAPLITLYVLILHRRIFFKDHCGSLNSYALIIINLTIKTVCASDLNLYYSPACTLLQVGGIEEYALCDAIKTRRLFKPVIAWCIGTCAKMFTTEVQFGHAGACANAERETADAKNKALLAAGAHVPDSFDTLGTIIGLVILCGEVAILLLI